MIRRDLLTSLRLPCGDKYRLVIRQGDIDALYVFIAQNRGYQYSYVETTGYKKGIGHSIAKSHTPMVTR